MWQQQKKHWWEEKESTKLLVEDLQSLESSWLFLCLFSLLDMCFTHEPRPGLPSHGVYRMWGATLRGVLLTLAAVNRTVPFQPQLGQTLERTPILLELIKLFVLVQLGPDPVSSGFGAWLNECSVT